ncbi:tRNA (adenosine(37)-N6)-threonylcarbamoyltransferase complex dimerization subunit type 1 TsaB [Fodinicurvata halophila]|uniref:tRNA (adenosine(37)-N6)-threonylcarbamoyltransferase complex dimerization subunit type 1 TsaB n=1 Tax=Fodinicurvata halophila TaxID=1419723 RepID=UPI003631B042
MTPDSSSGPTVLALDTSGSAGSAAVFRQGHVAAARFEIRSRGHAERLMPMIAEVLEEAATSYQDITRLAVTVGPGSFTGVRVGLATARALALGLECPLLCLDSFALLAEQAREARSGDEDTDTPLAVLIDSRRGDVFLRCYAASGAPLGSPEGCSPDALLARLPRGPCGWRATARNARLPSRNLRSSRTGSWRPHDTAMHAAWPTGRPGRRRPTTAWPRHRST